MNPQRLIQYLTICSLLGGCAPAEDFEDELTTQTGAINVTNGLEINGQKFNGMKLNGQYMNGMKLNGISFGGMKYGGSSVSNVKISKSVMSGTLSNGSTISGRDFEGVTFQGILENGVAVTLRVDDMNSSDTYEGYVYYLSAKDDSGKWYPTCIKGSSNVEPAVPVNGVWSPSGTTSTSTTQFTFSCRDMGAIGKCMKLGYKPWVDPARHAACVRMIRADYCGDGKAYTVDGNIINVYDNVGIQKDNHTSYSYNWKFNAEWGVNGATCRVVNARPGSVIPSCVSTLPDCSSSTSSFRTGTLLKNWVAY